MDLSPWFRGPLTHEERAEIEAWSRQHGAFVVGIGDRYNAKYLCRLTGMDNRADAERTRPMDAFHHAVQRWESRVEIVSLLNAG